MATAVGWTNDGDQSAGGVRLIQGDVEWMHDGGQSVGGIGLIQDLAQIDDYEMARMGSGFSSMFEETTGLNVFLWNGEDPTAGARNLRSLVQGFAHELHRLSSEGVKFDRDSITIGFALYVSAERNLLENGDNFHSEPGILANRYDKFAALWEQMDPTVGNQARDLVDVMRNRPERFRDDRLMNGLQYLVHYAEARDGYASMAIEIMKLMVIDKWGMVDSYATDLVKELFRFYPEQGPLWINDFGLQGMLYLLYGGETDLFLSFVTFLNEFSSKKANYFEELKFMPDFLKLFDMVIQNAIASQLNDNERKVVIQGLAAMTERLRRARTPSLLNGAGGLLEKGGQVFRLRPISDAERLYGVRGYLSGTARNGLNDMARAILKRMMAVDDGTPSPSSSTQGTPTPASSASAPASSTPDPSDGTSASTASDSLTDWITAVSRAVPRYVSTAIAGAVGYVSSLEYSSVPAGSEEIYGIDTVYADNDEIYGEDEAEFDDQDTGADNFTISGFAAGATEFYQVPMGI